MKLDLSESSFASEDGVTSRTRDSATSSGVFVMYNCARLATLLRRFEQEVERGTYPPLPPVDEIKFELLREEVKFRRLPYSTKRGNTGMTPFNCRKSGSSATVFS